MEVRCNCSSHCLRYLIDINVAASNYAWNCSPQDIQVEEQRLSRNIFEIDLLASGPADRITAGDLRQSREATLHNRASPLFARVKAPLVPFVRAQTNQAQPTAKHNK